MRHVLAEHEPGSVLVPVITGGTDAKCVGPLGIKVYGFVPMRYEGPSMTGLAHNHDERGPAWRTWEFGTRIVRCGQPLLRKIEESRRQREASP